MPSNTAQNDIYTRRINTVISYVRQNLDGDLSLNALSRVGCFSKFHFHRVFKSITEETVNDMVVRMRLERAANLLRTVPRLSGTFIADLTTAADAFEASFSNTAAATAEHVAATADTSAKIREGMLAKRILDGVVQNKYNNDPGKLAAWLSASHTEKAPKKKAPTP